MYKGGGRERGVAGGLRGAVVCALVGGEVVDRELPQRQPAIHEAELRGDRLLGGGSSKGLLWLL